MVVHTRPHVPAMYRPVSPRIVRVFEIASPTTRTASPAAFTPDETLETSACTAAGISVALRIADEMPETMELPRAADALCVTGLDVALETAFEIAAGAPLSAGIRLMYTDASSMDPAAAPAPSAAISDSLSCLCRNSFLF